MVYPREILNGVPIFEPTMEEFADFEEYMSLLTPFGLKSGIVKIIPPAEWKASLPEVTPELLKGIKIKNPIYQQIAGSKGIFHEANIEKQRCYNIVQWKSLSQDSSYQPPAGRGKLRDFGLSKGDLSALRAKNKQILNTSHDDDEMFKDFDFHIDTKEFTVERCQELEKAYWKSLSFAEPLYGADVEGTLFDDRVKTWNLRELPGMLSLLDKRVPGVNTTYLYAGLWKATFSWHLEDQDLYSINYLHFGAPKQWYAIPQKDKEKLDDVMRLEFPNDAKKCKEFLRHKTFMASPKYLNDRGIQVNQIVHNAGEFMITYPFGYHAGFNYGYNLAEAVNFAAEEWIPFAMKTARCLCITDSVQIDIADLLHKWRKYKAKHKKKKEHVIPRKRPVTEMISLDSEGHEEGNEKDEEEDDCKIVVPDLESPTDFRSSPMIHGSKTNSRSSSTKTVKPEIDASLTKSPKQNQIQSEDSEDEYISSSDHNAPPVGAVPEAFDYESEESLEDSEDDYLPEGSKKRVRIARQLTKTKKNAHRSVEPNLLPKCKTGNRTNGRTKFRKVEDDENVTVEETSINESDDQQCFLCPSTLPKQQTKYEDFKILPTNQYLDLDKDRFVHLFCAKTLNPSSITKDRSGLKYVDLKLIKLNGTKICQFCKINFGVTLRCSKRTCNVWFHPICGQESGVQYKYTGEHYCPNHAESTDMKQHFFKRLNKDELVQFQFEDGFSLGAIQEIDHNEKTLKVLEFPLGAGEEIMVKFSDIVNLNAVKILNSTKNVIPPPTDQMDIEEILSDDELKFKHSNITAPSQSLKRSISFKDSQIEVIDLSDEDEIESVGNKIDDNV